jgi:alpha-N-arabinofuranosidase
MTGFAQTDAIRIDLNKKGADVSPNLYGIFFEEINHAGDGGLYAELVQNRGFEEHVLPSGMTYVDGKAVAVDSPNYEHRVNRKWSTPWNVDAKKMLAWEVKALGGTAKFDVVKPDEPLHPNTPNAMQISISSLNPGGKVVLTNTGYWGMGLKSGDKYDLRFYVKSADYKGNITARISEGQGTITFKAKKIKDWTEFTGVLTSTTTTPDGQLQLEFDAPGTIYVDYVSLFPQKT